MAITEGFDKMDEVKKWDLAQLPGFEAIEEPKEDEGPKIAKFKAEDLDRNLINKKAQNYYSKLMNTTNSLLIILKRMFLLLIK